MKKIYWTAAEWDQILPRAEMEFEANHGLRKWPLCLDGAQRAVLTPDRQRDIASFNSYTKDRIKDQRARAKELLAQNAAKKQEERLRQQAEPLVIPPPPPDLAIKIKSLLREPGIDFPAKLDSVLNDAVDHLMVLFEEKLRARIETSTLNIFGNIADITETLRTKEPQKVQKPKLAVVGVMQKHLAEYQKDFSDFFHVEFIDGHQVGQLADKLRNKEYVAINTAYISHSVTLIVKKIQPAHVIQAHGYNQLHDEILNFIVNSKVIPAQKA